MTYKRKPSLEDKLDAVMEAVLSVGKRVDKMEQGLTATEQIQKIIDEKKLEPTPPSTIPQPEPEKDETIVIEVMPPEYRKIVDEVLGEQFEAHISYHDCAPTHFNFAIIVPKGLTSNSDVAAGKIPQDRRSKSVLYAHGANGVREWCKLVRKNLANYYAQQGMKMPFEIEK